MVVLSIACVSVCGCKGECIIAFSTVPAFEEPFDALSHPYCMPWLVRGEGVL